MDRNAVPATIDPEYAQLSSDNDDETSASFPGLFAGE
jgi:hypothetical protein